MKSEKDFWERASIKSRLALRKTGKYSESEISIQCSFTFEKYFLL